jgi:hypothetical protein
MPSLTRISTCSPKPHALMIDRGIRTPFELPIETRFTFILTILLTYLQSNYFLPAAKFPPGLAASGGARDAGPARGRAGGRGAGNGKSIPVKKSCANNNPVCLTGNEDEPGLELTRLAAYAEMARLAAYAEMARRLASRRKEGRAVSPGCQREFRQPMGRSS